MIWREKRVLLGVLGALLLINAIFFFTYRVQYQSRLDALDARLEQAEQDLDRTRSSRMMTERTLESYRKVEGDVILVFDQHWSTQGERLTALIAEVKRLAVASNLVPPAYAFTRSQGTTTLASARQSSKQASLGANEVLISFVVQGTYAEVRRLINLLELSNQFIIIESITISEAGDTLTLNLQLKTLFRDTSASGTGGNSRL